MNFCKRLMLLSWLLMLTLPNLAQLGYPLVEEVYGGRIRGISAVAQSPTQTRVYLVTESANSLFYTDVSHSGSGVSFAGFATVADVDSNDSFGKNIDALVADPTSGYAFFVHLGALYSVDPGVGSRSQLPYMGVRTVTTHAGYLFFLAENGGNLYLHFGSIDPLSGLFSEAAASPAAFGGSGSGGARYSLGINPLSDSLYVFEAGLPGRVYLADQTYDHLSTATTFSPLDTTGLGSVEFSAFAIAPDGRLFLGGRIDREPDHDKFIAFSDNNGASWDTTRTGLGGTSGNNLTFAGDSAAYRVYFGTGWSSDRGQSGTWHYLGYNGMETHPNDGPVAIDPNNPDVVYLCTDMGVGMSENRGEEIFEINDGIEAVQVNDFDMNAAKTVGWTASKSGIRQVSGYGSGSEVWQVMFPNGDGSPYYSIAMDPSDSTGNTAYAGNVRLYKTSDGGRHWDRLFSTEDPGYGFTFWSYVSAIAVHPTWPDFVVVGVNSPESGVNGAIMFTADGGITWNRVDSGVYNPEVLDLHLSVSDSGFITVYAGCEYVNDGTHSSYGVKTVTFDTTTHAVTFDNAMPGETGTQITNFGAHAVSVNSQGDVFAAGRKGSSEEPRVYVKYAGSTYWQLLPSASLPANGFASAATVGFDAEGNEMPFVAVNAGIYYLRGSTWELGYQYPVGMDVNVLYWDDLLVGTGTGLYGHFFQPTGIAETDLPVAGVFTLAQNYPNPFNPVTTIEYQLKVASRVKMTVFNIAGQRVTTLVEGNRNAGRHQIRWEASQMPSGVYFYELEAMPVNGGGVFKDVRKMILLK